MRTAAGLVLIVSALLTSASAHDDPRIDKIAFRPATLEEGGGIFIFVLGNGHCAYSVDYGDGRRERRKADLPDQVRHDYEPGRAYEIVVKAEAPCEGEAQSRIDIRPIDQGIWGVTAKLASKTDPEIILTVNGRGSCRVTVDFGDGDSERYDLDLPAEVSHRYARHGTYDVHARTAGPCRGEGRVRVAFAK